VCMRVESGKPSKNGGWFHAEAPRVVVRRCKPIPPPPTINAAAMHRVWQSETSLAALQGLASELGVSEQALVAVGAAWATQHAAWAFPMRDGFGNTVGIRLRNEHGKFAVRGSRQGIFLAGALSGERTLTVCEGPTDLAAAVDLGFFAVGRPNCCCGGDEIRCYLRQHGCNRAVIVSDNDKPGLDGAWKVGVELKVPFVVYVPPAKDLREFVRLGGTRTMIENSVKGLLWQSGSR